MSAVRLLAYNGDIVAIKMGRRQARGERMSGSIRNRSRGRGTAAGPFSSQPSGPRPVGCFSALLIPYVSDLDMLVARALKNSQLTRGDVIIICETVH
jgi:hypothetical protein